MKYPKPGVYGLALERTIGSHNVFVISRKQFVSHSSNRVMRIEEQFTSADDVRISKNPQVVKS